MHARACMRVCEREREREREREKERERESECVCTCTKFVFVSKYANRASGVIQQLLACLFLKTSY